MRRLIKRFLAYLVTSISLINIIAVKTDAGYYEQFEQQAPEMRIIYVVNNVHSLNGDRIIYRSIRNWNWNSTSRLVLSNSCVPDVQCVTVSLALTPNNESGLANPWREFIKIHPVAWESPWQIRQGLLCHELGHILGLGHTGQGCMQSPGLDNYRPGVYNRSIIPSRLLDDWIR